MMDDAVNDANCLSFWYPRIKDAVPTPKTTIVEMPPGIQSSFHPIFDGKPVRAPGLEWVEKTLRPAVERMGVPCFLRTGHTSGKHEWAHTCHVTDASNLVSHVARIMNFCECAGMFGELPYQVWAVREMLPTLPLANLPDYAGMPLCREFRCFVRDGAIECVHPYWPEKSIHDGFPRVQLQERKIQPGEDFDWQGERVEWPRELPDDFAALVARAHSATEDEMAAVRDLAERAGSKVYGYWSIDVLETTRGWYVTDMADGERSWHWEGCEKRAAA